MSIYIFTSLFLIHIVLFTDDFTSSFIYVYILSFEKVWKKRRIFGLRAKTYEKHSVPAALCRKSLLLFFLFRSLLFRKRDSFSKVVIVGDLFVCILTYTLYFLNYTWTITEKKSSLSLHFFFFSFHVLRYIIISFLCFGESTIENINTKKNICIITTRYHYYIYTWKKSILTDYEEGGTRKKHIFTRLTFVYPTIEKNTHIHTQHQDNNKKNNEYNQKHVYV